MQNSNKGLLAESVLFYTGCLSEEDYSVDVMACWLEISCWYFWDACSLHLQVSWERASCLDEMVAFDVDWIIREAVKIEFHLSSVNIEVTLSWTGLGRLMFTPRGCGGNC